MKIYRLEHATDHAVGPFGNPPSEENLFGFLGMRTSPVDNPAEAALVVAVALGQPSPWRFGKLVNDGITKSELRNFIHANHHQPEDVHHAFASLTQYREWFASKEQRRALFQKYAYYGKEEFSHNDLELREYEVPADKVLKADHQVAFFLTDAKPKRVIPYERAVA